MDKLFVIGLSFLSEYNMARKAVPKLDIANYLSPARIIIVKQEDITDKARLIERLCSLIGAESPSLDMARICAKVLEREKSLTTTLDTGLGLPHARVDGLQDFIMALAVLPDGLPDPAKSGVVIKAMALFLSPADSKFFQKHLQLLATLSSLFQPALMDRLAAEGAPDKILAALSSIKN